MSAYIIVLDLKRRRKSYTELDERLARFDACWQVRDDLWMVISECSSAEMHEQLRPHLGTEDKLFIARTESDTSWSGYGQRVSTWLSQNLSNRI